MVTWPSLVARDPGEVSCHLPTLRKKIRVMLIRTERIDIVYEFGNVWYTHPLDFVSQEFGHLVWQKQGSCPCWVGGGKLMEQS